jgi:hypothetical protein
MPSQDEGDFLRQCFNQADRHIGIQNKATLVRAIEFVDRKIAGAESLAKKTADEQQKQNLPDSTDNDLNDANLPRRSLQG